MLVVGYEGRSLKGGSADALPLCLVVAAAVSMMACLNDMIDESQRRRQLDLRSRGVHGGIRSAQLPRPRETIGSARRPRTALSERLQYIQQAAHIHHSCSMLCKTAPRSSSRSDRSLATSRGFAGGEREKRRRANNVLHSVLTGAGTR